MCVENDLVELDAAATLTAAEANEHALITAETRRLQIAAHWADLHPGDGVTRGRLPGTQHPIRFGGEGTPTVADFAPAELGCVLRMSDGSAARLIGDALDLRHRLKLIWAAALAGQVPAYQARRIAAATPTPHRRPGRLGGRPTRPIVGDAVVGSAAHPAGGQDHRG